MTITAYRIIKKEYAGTIWSGFGAREYGGRWNSKGVAVVYTAENRSLAAMEQLVHLVKPRVLKGYVIASIRFDEGQMQRLEANGLRAGWNNPVAPASLRKYGDDWVAAAGFVSLAVPSVVIPGEWNYLLNPGHPDIGALSKTAPSAFVSDDRLD